MSTLSTVVITLVPPKVMMSNYITEKDLRSFTFKQVEVNAADGGMTILEILSAATMKGYPSRLVKDVLHEAEARGSLWRDWNRRYQIGPRKL